MIKNGMLAKSGKSSVKRINLMKRRIAFAA
jgi:hypothetical protein